MYEVILNNEGVETIINAVSVDLSSPKLLNGNIKQGINNIDSFMFNILPNNSGYNCIGLFKSTVEVINTIGGKTVFRGRVLIAKEKMSEDGKLIKTVVCEGELGYLMDSIQEYGEYHNISVRDFLQLIIDRHNKQVEEDKRFVLGNVTVEDNNDSLYRFLNYGKTLDVIKDKLIDRLGGELKIRYEYGVRYLDYVSSIGEKKGLEIVLSKNLRSLEEEKDPTNIISRLTPLGAKIGDSEERLTIESINNGIKYIDDIEAIDKFGIIEGAVIWDDVTIESNLLKKGKEYLLENNKVKNKYKINALDLSVIGIEIEEFEVGNIYRVINPIMNIDEYLRVIEKNIILNSPQKSSLIFGSRFINIKDYQLKNVKANKEVKEVREIVRTTVNTLSSVTKELDDTVGILNNTNENMGNLAEVVKANADATNVIANTLVSINNRLDKLARRVNMEV